MPRMDAAGPADAKNASTGPWKTAQNAVSHSAHTQHHHAPHTKKLTLPKYRKELLREGVESLLAGDLDTGKAILRVYINATIGFEELSRVTKRPTKSLMRCSAPPGIPRRATPPGIPRRAICSR